MDYYKFDQFQADQVAIANWASEVAKNKPHSERRDSDESYCINSEVTRKRQSDIFFKNHRLRRRQH